MSKRKWTHVCVADHFSSLGPLEEEEKRNFCGAIIITEGEKMRISNVMDGSFYSIYTSRNKISKNYEWYISPEDFKKYFKEIK